MDIKWLFEPQDDVYNVPQDERFCILNCPLCLANFDKEDGFCPVNRTDN